MEWWAGTLELVREVMRKREEGEGRRVVGTRALGCWASRVAYW